MADELFALFADSDSEADFEGFELENLVDDVQNGLPTFTMDDHYNDMDIDRDLRLGWKREVSDPLVTPFTGNTGVNFNIAEDDLTPYTLFKLFLSEDDFQSMSDETNRYSQTFLLNNTGRHARIRSWYDTTADEIKQFLGLFIVMGLVDKPFMEKYWSTDATISTPLFGNTMPRDRFFNILSCFHLNNNDNFIPRGNDGHDPLFKLRPIYDVTKDKFLTVYTPEQNLALDEAISPWKGRLMFKQYIPNKPDRFGVKFYVLCEASSGYVCQYDIYTGKDYDPNPEGDELDEQQGHSYNVVMGLLQRCEFLNKGHTVYVDNFYYSPTLFTDLNSEGTNAVGTVRTNRKEMPEAFKTMKLKKGEVVYRQRDNLFALRWKDKRDVHMLSTIHTNTFSVTGKVDRVTNEPIVILSCILDYNSNMGGVDRCDQMAKYYSFARKSVKWWKKVAFFILNMVVTNAYILYTKLKTGKMLSHYDFRRELANELMCTFVREAKKGRRLTGNLEKRLTERHFLAVIPAKENAKNQRPCRKCVVCNISSGKRNASGERKRKETRYWCPDCEVALCVEDCFRRYHTVRHYQVRQQNSSSETDSSENE